MTEGSESRNLSPLQQRLIALMLEGLSDSAAWRGLGFDEEDLAEETEQIRRLLDVPSDANLADHLSITLPDPEHEAAHPRPEDERRLRLLLRLTISELMEVSENASIRSSMLTQTIEELGSDDVDSALREAKELSKVSEEIKAMVKKVLEDIRGME